MIHAITDTESDDRAPSVRPRTVSTVPLPTESLRESLAELAAIWPAEAWAARDRSRLADDEQRLRIELLALALDCPNPDRLVLDVANAHPVELSREAAVFLAAALHTIARERGVEVPARETRPDLAPAVERVAELVLAERVGSLRYRADAWTLRLYRLESAVVAEHRTDGAACYQMIASSLAARLRDADAKLATIATYGTAAPYAGATVVGTPGYTAEGLRAAADQALVTAERAVRVASDLRDALATISRMTEVLLGDNTWTGTSRFALEQIRKQATFASGEVARG